MRFIKSLLRARMDVWELLLVLAFAGFLVYVWRARQEPDPQSASEWAYFEKKYGPAHNTEREEEWLIRDFFGDRRGGFFVDVGANHYRIASKSYYLETVLGWSGIAIEPQREFGPDYAVHRPRTRFFPLFVSSESDRTAQLYVLRDKPFVASSNKEFVSGFGTPDEARSVPTVSLNDLLTREGVQRLDLLTIDIELHEPQALKGFDIDRFRPALVCIEGLLPVRQQILDYFTGHRYVLVGRYMWVDRENLYFAPLGAVH
jgi:FkbM family methyltransferase